MSISDGFLSRRELLKTAAGASLVRACQRGFAFGRRYNDDALLNECRSVAFGFFRTRWTVRRLFAKT